MISFLAVSGETLEVEVNELTKGLQDIQKDIEEISTMEEPIPGDMFAEIMTVSSKLYTSRARSTDRGGGVLIGGEAMVRAGT